MAVDREAIVDGTLAHSIERDAFRHEKEKVASMNKYYISLLRPLFGARYCFDNNALGVPYIFWPSLYEVAIPSPGHDIMHPQFVSLSEADLRSYDELKFFDANTEPPTAESDDAGFARGRAYNSVL